LTAHFAPSNRISRRQAAPRRIADIARPRVATVCPSTHTLEPTMIRTAILSLALAAPLGAHEADLVVHVA
jgi:hypothetical protein